MASIKVEMIRDKNTWDTFVDESPEATIFHKWELLKIVEKHSGYKLLTYGAYSGNKLISVFPVFYRKELMFRIVTTAPPQAGIPYLGPILHGGSDTMKTSTKEKCLHAIIESVIAEINKLSPNYTYIQMAPMHNDIRAFKWNEFQEESNFTYFIDIDRSPEEILASFDYSARRMIKEAGKKNLDVRQFPHAYTFYEIMQERYAEQGLTLPLLSPEYLKDLLEAYPENMRMYSLYSGKNIVSIIIATIFHGRMTLWLGNPKPKGDFSSNEYLIWETIIRAKEEGCKELEINGAGERRLCQFKSKFNPRLEVSYVVSRKDGLGSMAEWAYTSFKKKMWV